MKLTTKTILFVTCLLATLLVSHAALAGDLLKTAPAQDSELTGTFDVILYGCNYFNDPESIVFFDRADDALTFDPFAPSFNYRVRKGVNSADLLEHAKKFLNCNVALRGFELKKIVAEDNRVIGYELRPHYDSFVYGITEPLSVYYRIKGDKVRIDLRLDPSVEHMLREGNDKPDR